MAKSRPELPRMSNLEQDIMQAVWDLGECTSSEVIEAYTKTRPLAKTTIRTVLTSLYKKGYVERVPTTERGYRLRPTVTRECIARRSLKDLVAGLFAGSPTQAISYLLNDEKIDEAELKEIRRMLDERKTGQSGREDQ